MKSRWNTWIVVVLTACLGLAWSILAQPSQPPATETIKAPANLSYPSALAALAEPPAPAAEPLDTAPPAATPATGPGTEPKPLTAGLDEAIGGHFHEAFTRLKEALTRRPDDSTAQAAVTLLQKYLSRFDRAEAERKAELAECATRVRNCMLAQAYMPTLAKSGLDKKLREKIQEAVQAYNSGATSDSLETAGPKEAQDAKTKTVTALDKCAAAVGEAAKVLKDDSSEYGKTFRALAQKADKLLKAQRQSWAALPTDGAKKITAAAKTIRAAEEELINSLGDVESLSNENPWRNALMQARLANLVAEKDDKLAEQSWYQDVVRDVERRAKEYQGKAQWYDALTAYAGLQDLDHDNETFRKMVQITQRHVRVLGLYGKKTPASQPALSMGPAGSTVPPATATTEESEPGWKELVAGVDADMVEKAIAQMDGYYVTAVDYRKVTRGGLTSVKVLAETPQASYSFPLLADDAKRKAFLDAIDGQLETIEKRDRVDHLDLQLALNSVLRASERTVQIPTEVLVVEFTDGFLDELDKFSSMIWPYDVADFQKQTMGHFFGIGIQITKDPGEPLKVVTPLPGSPAFRAGIKSGDFILAVDGRSTEDLGVDKLVRLITGEKDTKVTLTIKRAGMLKPTDIPIIRDEIVVRTIKGWRQLPGGEWDYTLDPEKTIGYIRMSQFTEQTPSELDAALTEIKKAGVKSLILDLRSNPGGLLRSATQVADEFLRSGRIVSTRGRQTKQTEINAQDSGQYLDGDLVVLVNQHSASAAEIVSGALQDWHRGTIVGQRSYGKGSVQNVIPIRNHKAFLKLTTAYYYLPSGRLLHRQNGAKTWGVDPDVEVLLTPRQTRHWLDIRRKTDLLQDIDPAEQEADLAEQYDADLQLSTSVTLLKLKQLQENRTKVAAQ